MIIAGAWMDDGAIHWSKVRGDEQHLGDARALADQYIRKNGVEKHFMVRVLADVL